MKKRMTALFVVIFVTIMIFGGCAKEVSGTKNANTTIVFGEAGWDSFKFHNAVARFIVEKAFGYKTEETSGSTAVTYQALQEGDVDVYMETWTDNIASYKDDVKNSKIQELGVNFDDDDQGLYVPRYVIEGDATRGIAPMAPDLKTVKDLLAYKDVFKDDEAPGKGRIYGAISGWEVDKILYNKFVNYGFEKEFTYFRPGSDAAMAAAFSSAYEKGEPIVGYYWEPTWLTGKYDLVLLKDEPYSQELFNDGKCGFAAVKVTVCASNDLVKKAPDVVEFLKNYKTSSQLTAKALSYMADNKASYEDTAIWFLKENEELWTKFLTDAQAKKVKDAIQ